MRCGDWRLIQNGTSEAEHGMAAEPVEGETPGARTKEHPARTPGARDAQTPAPGQRPATEPAPTPDAARTAGPGHADGKGSVPAPHPEPGVPEAAVRRAPASPPAPGPVRATTGGPDLDPDPDPAAAAGPGPVAATGSLPGADAVPRPERKGLPTPRTVSEATLRLTPVSRPGAEGKPGRESGLPSGPREVPSPNPRTAERPGTDPRPESDCERTSTFIALKPLDEAPAVPVPTWARVPAPAPVPVRPSPCPAPSPSTAALSPAPTPAPSASPAPAPAPSPSPAPGAALTPELPQGVAPSPEGTTEQPLPALDLLAQLTNTPPPPATPRRTVARRVRIWVPPLLLLVAVLAVVQALRPLPDAVLVSGDDAASSVTLDGRFDVPWPEKGQAAVRVGGAGDVGTFGEQKPVPTASVAKVMTAYVILKGHPLKKDEAGPQIEVDAKAVADGTSESESRIEGLTAGTRFSQQDMLKMLMIPSGNNIARLLARWDTGSDSEAAFVEKMNAEAKALGMSSTTYTDPSGLEAKTVSTAVDQLKLAEEVMKLDAFRAIVRLPEAAVPGLQKLINNNGNLLLSPLSIKGIKTGSSSAAGGALMWAAYKTVGDKTPLILGTMLDQRVTGADPSGSNSLILVKDNSKKVIEAVRAALTSAGAVKKGQVVGYVDDGLGTRTPVVATRDTAVVAVPGQRIALTLAADGKGLPEEARSGTEIGVLTIGTGPGAQTVPVALQSDLSGPSLGAKLLRLR